MKEEDKTQLAELIRGAEITFANAEQLFQEASLLRENGHLSRSIFLHQMAMEECAKVDMIGAAAVSILTGHQVDMKALTRSFRDHKAKNFANAYMAEAEEAELAARKANDHKAAIAAFEKSQKEIHTFLNNAKNASMYVDFTDGRFVSPNDVVTKDLAEMIAGVGYYYMCVTYPRIRLLQRVSREPDVVREWTKDLEETMTKLVKGQASLKDQEDAVMVYINEQLDKFAGRKKQTD